MLFAQSDFWCSLFSMVLLCCYSHQRPIDHFFLAMLVLLTQAGRDAVALGADPLRGQGGLLGWFCPGRWACFLLCCWCWKCVLLSKALSCSCTKLLMCCAVDRCLDLISNLWLFLKACSRDFIPTHTALVTPSISWVSKYRTEKIH